MIMEAKTIVERLDELGVKATVQGEYIELAPWSALSEEMLAELKAHKHEVMDLLKLKRRGCRFRYPGELATDEELEEISRDIIRGGYVLLWSNVLQDLVAFYMNAEDRTRIPPNFVPYSLDELCKLFGKRDSPLNRHNLKLIHEAKKGGAKVTGTQSEVRTCHACGGTSWWQREDGEYICQCCHPKPKKGL